MSNFSIKQLIKSLISDSPLIVEAGAHKGRDTVKMARLWPQSTIHAFEPVPELFEQLKEKTAGYSNVFCHNKALSASNFPQILYISSGSSDAASSLLKPEQYLIERPTTEFKRELLVQGITLESWVEQQKIRDIDLLWLDLQGAEYDILYASSRLLSHIKLIYTEINFTQRYASHPLFEQYKQWLEEQGFKLIYLEKNRITWGNALFQRI